MVHGCGSNYNNEPNELGKNRDTTMCGCGHSNNQHGLEAYIVYSRSGTKKVTRPKIGLKK